jgi:hypothetical protein
MPAMTIPPWLQAADPAAAYAQGLNIGARIGQDQAQQQLSEEQMQREDAKQAVEQAYRQQKFQLESDEQARKYAAQQQYEAAIQQGMDPAQAWLQFGPRMGIGGTGVAQALRFNEGPPQMTPYQQAEIELRRKALESKQQGKEYGDIQTVDLGEGVRAAFRPGSPGLHLINPKSEKTLSPSAAAALLSKLPEIDAMAGTTGTTNALSSTLGPNLLGIIKGAGKSAQGPKFKIVGIRQKEETPPSDNSATDDEGE